MTNTEMDHSVALALLPLAAALAVGRNSDRAWDELDVDTRADLRARGWADAHGLTRAGVQALDEAMGDVTSELVRRSTWALL